MRADEMHELDVDKLEAELETAREQLMRLRFQKASGTLTDQNLLKFARRNVARLLTVLGEKRRAESAKEGEA